MFLQLMFPVGSGLPASQLLSSAAPAADGGSPQLPWTSTGLTRWPWEPLNLQPLLKTGRREKFGSPVGTYFSVDFPFSRLILSFIMFIVTIIRLINI